jgi:hypothetical protein
MRRFPERRSLVLSFVLELAIRTLLNVTLPAWSQKNYRSTIQASDFRETTVL